MKISLITFAYLICLIQLVLTCSIEKYNTHWFGTFITCNLESSYTLDLAKNRCPSGQVLAEITDGSLYSNITQEISIKTQYNNFIKIFFN